MAINLPWRYEYDADGGYDGLTGAFVFTDAKGEALFDVDLQNFCGCYAESPRECDHREAREVAEAIYSAVNSAGFLREKEITR